MTTTEIIARLAIYDIVKDAIAAEQPLVVLYATQGTDDKARVIHPSKILSNKDGHDFVRAFDSLSNEVRSFRIDRLRTAHLLTTV